MMNRYLNKDSTVDTKIQNPGRNGKNIADYINEILPGN